MDSNFYEDETMAGQKVDVLVEDQIEIDFDDFDLDTIKTKPKPDQNNTKTEPEQNLQEGPKVVGSLMAPDDESSDEEQSDSDSLDLGDLGAPKLEVANNTVDDDDDFFDGETSQKPKQGSDKETIPQPEEVKAIQQLPTEEDEPVVHTNWKSKMTLTIEEQRKQNQLGNQVIAERPDESDDEDKPKESKHQEQAVGYRKKFSKISKFVEESTKEHKQEVREMGIQKETAEIVKKAQEEAKKIDNCKSKLRQSAMGGVITNSLASKAKQIAKNRAVQKKEQQKQEDQGQPKLKADLEQTEDVTATQKAMKKKKKKPNLQQKEQPPEIQIFDSHSIDQSVDKPLIERGKPQNPTTLQGRVDWDRLNEINATTHNQTVDPEEERKDLEARKKTMTYDQAHAYFVSQADIDQQLEEVKEMESAPSGIQKLFSCCIPKPKLANDKLVNQKNEIFAIAKVKYDAQIAEHEIIVKSLYKNLMKKDQCRSIGSHWQDIGFQATDPKTDIRGAGMFGVLQMLYMITTFDTAMDAILQRSQHDKYEFPLAVKMFEFSVMILKLLRLGKLTAWCNQEQDVWTVANRAYSATFFKFIHQYIVDSHDISTLAHVNSQIAAQLMKGKVQQFLQEFQFEGQSHDGYKMVKQAMKDAENLRLQKLQQDNQMVVVEQKQTKSQQRKQSRYAQGEEATQKEEQGKIEQNDDFTPI